MPASPPTNTLAQVPGPSKLDELREKATSLVDIALTPLERESSASFQGYVTDLRENNLDEAARRPTATPQTYKLADLVRESQDAARATQNNTVETAFHKGIKVQWGLRTVELHKYLDASIAQFRAALRQSVPPK